jgi:hypothetical protein
MPQPTPNPSSKLPDLMPRIQAALRNAWDNRGRIGCGLVVAGIGYVLLRGCIPSLSGNHLPAELESAVSETHTHCEQDFPIWPGEVRMPTCDTVTSRYVGKGAVPASRRAQGITKAICYQVDIEEMFWGESGSQKHEMAWAQKTYSKVAVRQDGRWILYPDEEQADRSRWAEYACPGEYEASSSLIPR